jgi:hypothetical protein
MVAGGGASVAYADTITDMGYGHELANYGGAFTFSRSVSNRLLVFVSSEYSGAPSEEQTYEYAKTILKLMGYEKRADGRGKVRR